MKAKLGAGLESLRGKLGGYCGKVINGRQQISRLSIPFAVNGGEPSGEQTWIRMQYALAVRDWRAASEEQRAAWDLLGEPDNISGFDYLVHLECSVPTDRGLNWSMKQAVDENSFVRSIAYIGGGVCLGITDVADLLYRSIDYGTTWTVYSDLEAVGHFHKIVYCGGTTLLAIGTGTSKVYKSINSGLTWSPITVMAGNYLMEAIEYIGNGVCLVGAFPYGALYRSTDYGDIWVLVAKGSILTGDGACNYVSTIASRDGGVVLAGVTGEYYGGAYVLRSADYGVTWVLIQQLGIGIRVTGFGWLPNGCCVACVQDDTELYKSLDVGLTWVLIQTLSEYEALIDFVYLGGGVCMAGENSDSYGTGGVWISTNYGDTWTPLLYFPDSKGCFSLTFIGGGMCVAGQGMPGAFWRSP